MNLNLVQICGRITKALEPRKTAGGKEVLSFSVATNRTWKNADGEKQEEVEFHNVVSFGKQAEIITKYFDKGDEIYIQGYLKTASWEDKDSGKKQYRTEIIAEKFEFGQKARSNQGGSRDNYNDETGGELPAGSKDSDEINIEDIQF